MFGTDPNHPNKGMGMTTSFILFLKENRDRIIRENPHFQQKEIAAMGGKLWRALPEATRAEYKIRADQMFREKK